MKSIESFVKSKTWPKNKLNVLNMFSFNLPKKKNHFLQKEAGFGKLSFACCPFNNLSQVKI